MTLMVGLYRPQGFCQQDLKLMEEEVLHPKGKHSRPQRLVYEAYEA